MPNYISRPEGLIRLSDEPEIAKQEIESILNPEPVQPIAPTPEPIAPQAANLVEPTDSEN